VNTKAVTESGRQAAILDGSAWAAFCDHLKQAGQQILRPEAPADPLTRAEGFRYLSRLLRSALEIYVEFDDPGFPVLYRPAHETIKLGADSPDNYYQKAVLDSRYTYRLHGHRGTVHYLGLSTKAGNYDSSGRLDPTGFLDSREMQINDDGTFEVIISTTKQPGNWLPMKDDTEGLIIRQTFLDREKERPAELHIERVDKEAAPLPLDGARFVSALERAAAFVEGSARLFADWAQDLKNKVNELPPADQQMCQSLGGDPTIFYYHGYWKLAEDEAMLIELDRIPQCEMWNFQLDNYWMESLDYRYHRIHFNRHTARLAADGSLRLVVAHQDPGLPNWIETAGHREGTTAFRWIAADEILHPRVRVVPFADLAGLS